jgi:hypothetical protein
MDFSISSIGRDLWNAGKKAIIDSIICEIQIYIDE